MYEIVKSVLMSGNYNLSDITTKINALWVQGSLTTEEYNELLAMARSGAKVEHSVDFMAKLEEIDKRLTAVEKSNATPDDTVDDFVAGKWYYNGDKCVFEGKTYTCIAPEGVACVWSPWEYPAYWEEI